MNVLGLKIEGHDPGAAVISGKKVVAIAEERLNRTKHSQGKFPILSIDYCLEELGVGVKDLDLIVIDHTSRKTGKNIEELFYQYTGDRFKDIRLEVISHHEAHAASAFFCSPFEESAVMVYDGRGSMLVSELGTAEVETESFFRGKGNKLTFIDRTVHQAIPAKGVPQVMGIGMLYDRMTHDYTSLGRHNAGKLMGLAAYGDDSLLQRWPLENWVKEHNGRLVCNGEWRYKKPTDSPKKQRPLNKRLKKFLVEMREYVLFVLRQAILLITRRNVDVQIFKPIELGKPARDPEKDVLPDEWYASAAYAAQTIFEYFAVSVARRLKDITQSDNLCVSGGCALNIDSNRSFLTKVGYKDLYVQPASSDCGIALGCALWGKHVVLDQPRDWVMTSAALGKEYDETDITKALDEYKDKVEWKKSDAIARETATYVADGKIIGWFQGRSEYGPRALGQRSIVCNAAKADMRDVLNARVKNREMWRPFAMSILSEELENWFDLRPNSATGFMLLAAEVKDDKRSVVPSVVHVDNTCRMQTVTKEDNDIYYDMIKEFEILSNIPLVLNTSFNLGGEPIVETPADALSTFTRTDMDYLVLGDYVVTKK